MKMKWMFLLGVPWLLAANAAAIDDHGNLRGRHLQNIFHRCTPSLIDSKCVYKRRPTTTGPNPLQIDPTPNKGDPVVRHCEDFKILDNGATLSVMLATTQYSYQISESIKLDGNTSIGDGAAQGQTREHHWTYVIDVSPSTANTPCGILGNVTPTVLDCEKQAVLGLHAEIQKSGSAVDYGLTSFSTDAKTVLFPVPSGDSLVTTDRGEEEGEMADAVDLLTFLGDITADLVGGGTNYPAALRAAADSISASSAKSKHIIFLSDGEYTVGSSSFLSALTDLKNMSAKIFSFAVGNGSSCTGTNATAGTLQRMANETGGVCKNVMNAADLGNELKDLVKSIMVKDRIIVDDVRVVGATQTKAPPFNGPGVDQLSYTVPASSLGAGFHEACIRSVGRGPADVLASREIAECCVSFEVKTDSPPPPPRHCEDFKILDNGATLSVMLAATQSLFKTSESINIDGNTSIGEGAVQGQTREHHWTYVIDVSPSTANTPCGIPGDTTTHILDCEKQAILGVHAEIEDSESAIDYGLTYFSTNATTIPFEGSPVTTDRGEEEGEMADAVRRLTIIGDITADRVGGATNFAAALRAAAVSISASSATSKHIIFLSDGESNVGSSDFLSALTDLKNMGAKIFSFAVGDEASCTGTNATDGTLQRMADETGGVCKNVMNAADLDNELKNLVKSKMMNETLTVGGVSVVATHTNTPPFDGPGVDQLSYTEPASSLGAGIYEACISATGRGPADVPASDEIAECCVTFEVEA